MAHFAKIDRVGTVVDVVVVDDAVLKGEDGSEVEQKGVDFLSELFGGAPQWDWKQTSYNTRGGKHYKEDNTESDDQSKALRKNYAGIGYTYDEDRDAFYSPKPYASFTLDETTCYWKAPVDEPSDTNYEADTSLPIKNYEWNEETQAWDLISTYTYDSETSTWDIGE